MLVHRTYRGSECTMKAIEDITSFIRNTTQLYNHDGFQYKMKYSLANTTVKGNAYDALTVSVAIATERLQLARVITSLFALLIAVDDASQCGVTDLLLRARFLFARFYSKCRQQNKRQLCKSRWATPDQALCMTVGHEGMVKLTCCDGEDALKYLNKLAVSWHKHVAGHFNYPKYSQ